MSATELTAKKVIAIVRGANKLGSQANGDAAASDRADVAIAALIQGAVSGNSPFQNELRDVLMDAGGYNEK